MITVKNKNELEKAIASGYDEIFIDNVKLQAACYLASKYQKFKLGKKSIIDNMRQNNAIACSSGEVIVVTMILCITVVAIIAILNKYNVEIDYKNGKITVKK